MKKLKDFIYNTNDILIALLILVVAAGIIIWRMNVILDYPKELLGTSDYTESSAQDLSSETSAQSSEVTQMPSDVTTMDEADDQEAESTDASENTSIFSEDGTLQETLTVDIEGNSASAAVGCMIDAGLFDDYDEYSTLCEDNGLDPEKIAAGRFKFVAGSSKLDIAKQVNWG